MIIAIIVRKYLYVNTIKLQQFSLSTNFTGTYNSSNSRYLTLIKVILNYAIKMDYIHYKVHPFAACILPSSRIRNLDLTVDELKSLRDVSLKEQNLLIVRDLFMLTYYLGGINLKDLLDYHLRKTI